MGGGWSMITEGGGQFSNSWSFHLALPNCQWGRETTYLFVTLAKAGVQIQTDTG
jgi:hypothetical protein